MKCQTVFLWSKASSNEFFVKKSLLLSLSDFLRLVFNENIPFDNAFQNLREIKQVPNPSLEFILHVATPPGASLLHIRFNIQPVDDSPPLQSNPVVVLEHLMKLLESILQVRDQPWALGYERCIHFRLPLPPLLVLCAITLVLMAHPCDLRVCVRLLSRATCDTQVKCTWERARHRN